MQTLFTPPGAALPMLVLMSMLSGCAGFSRDSGFGEVAAATQAQLGQTLLWPRSEAEQAKSAARVTALLSQPLSAADAVQVALLNNRALRADFENLRISEADLVQSGRLPNPRFDLRHATAAGQYDIEESLSFNVLALLTMPYVHAMERGRFAQAQAAVTLAVTNLAAATREAYFRALAARETLAYLRQVSNAAAVGAELARRMVEAGHWNSLDQAREQIFDSDAAANLTRAQAADTAARERLLRLLGLADEDDAVPPGTSPSSAASPPAVSPPAVSPPLLAQRLPDLPQQIDAQPDVERVLLQNRIDLRLQRLELDELAHRLKLTRATRFIDVLEAGPERVKQGTRGAAYEQGFGVTLEIPIFDGGAVRTRRAEALYAQAADRFAQSAIEARSQIRERYSAYRASFELAKQLHDEVVPLRKAVADQNLLRYNASLVSIFELLADARAQIGSVNDYIEALRDFWVAKSKLDDALLGNHPS